VLFQIYSYIMHFQINILHFHMSGFDAGCTERVTIGVAYSAVLCQLPPSRTVLTDIVSRYVYIF
jgi:hypothetical protein